MAASSKWGETTRMRLSAAGSISPHVGSANVLLMDGSYGHVVDLTGDVVPEHGQQCADDGGTDDAGEATRDDGELDAGQRGDGAGLHVTEAWPALHDGHLNGGHAAAEPLGNGALQHGVPQHGGNDVGPARHGQEGEGDPERVGEPEECDGGSPA